MKAFRFPFLGARVASAVLVGRAAAPTPTSGTARTAKVRDHLVMMAKNKRQVADFLESWIRQRVQR